MHKLDNETWERRGIKKRFIISVTDWEGVGRRGIEEIEEKKSGNNASALMFPFEPVQRFATLTDHAIK